MKKMKIMKTLTSVAVLAIASNSAWAGGTASGTDVDNVAEITYSVGGTLQTKIESSEAGNSTPGEITGNETTFVVDKKVDLVVTPPASSTTVSPNSDGLGTTNDLTFVVTNEGNDPENFSFSVSDIVGGDFDPTTCTATPSTAAALAADASVNVVVSCEIPDLGTAPNGGVAAAGTVANGNTAVVDLLATVTGVTASTGADDPAAIDTVFADGTGTSQDTADRNAQHAAEGTYTVSSANLLVSKTQSVTKMALDLDDDGSTTGTGNATGDETDVAGGYHIPGSTITYLITVSNAAGAATADGIVITDAVPATMTLVSTPVLSGNATGSATSGTANAVVTPAFNLTAGQSATLTIIARIN